MLIPFYWHNNWLLHYIEQQIKKQKSKNTQNENFKNNYLGNTDAFCIKFNAIASFSKCKFRIATLMVTSRLLFSRLLLFT